MTIAITPMNTRYRPLAQIGRGAMAEVVLAEMLLAEGVTGLAALKRLWPALADDPELVAMFLREGRLCQRMNHPNVVRTYEVVEHAEGASIAMEYLEGQTLARVLNRLVDGGGLDLAARLGVLVDVLAGLDYVHELGDFHGTAHGIVHRDVNPQNVFVTYDGVVKVMDFGVAKSATDPYQTRPGALRGKLAYLAPEQALGERVDRRADVFSVGVMLWELVTGRRMWQAMTEASIMRRLVAGGLPPLPWDPAVPAALAKVCARALAREPAARFPTARAFAAELRRAMPEVEIYQRRQLGSVVALAFAPERAARSTLIEEHLRLARGPLPGSAGRSAAAVRAQEQLPPPWQRERSTPRTAWTMENPPWPGSPPEAAPHAGDAPAGAYEPAVVASAIVSEGPASATPSAVTPAPTPFHRARWMAVGFAMAVLLAATAVGAGAARSDGADKRAPGTQTAGNPVAPPPAPPAVVPLATVPFDLKDDPRVAATTELDPVAAPLDAHRQRARSRSARTGDLARVAARAGGGERPSAPVRPAPVDDEVLAPTINLTASTPVGVPRGAASLEAAPSGSVVVPAVPAEARRAAVKVLDVTDPFVP